MKVLQRVGRKASDKGRYLVLLAIGMKRLCSSWKIPQGTGKRGRNKIILFAQSCLQMVYHGVRVTHWGNFEEIIPRDSIGYESRPNTLLLFFSSSLRPVHPHVLNRRGKSLYLLKSRPMSRSIQIHLQFPVVIYIFLFRTLGS